MALIYDKVVALARQSTNGLNVYPYAEISILDSDTNAALMYEDADGLVPISNPATADENGELRFYVEEGVYTISVQGGAYEPRAVL